MDCAVAEPRAEYADFLRAKVQMAELLRVLDYDQDTGVFRWREQVSGRALVGAVAGRPRGLGYWGIHVGGRSYPAHHVAWFYVHGVWPSGLLDHRNLVRDDNRIANLREATASGNRQNTTLQRNNTSGFKGVTRRGSRWHAEIMVDNQAINLGSFASPQDASAAYLTAKRSLHPLYVEGQGVRRDGS